LYSKLVLYLCGFNYEVMRFYNREKEIAELYRIQEQSLERGQFTIVTGRRRIGKTQLLVEAFKNTPSLYLFVSRKEEALLCKDFQKQIASELNVPLLGDATTFIALFEFLVAFSKQNPITIIIDEFQDFYHVNSSIYSDIQRVWDLNKEKCKLNFIVSGSVISLMHKIFEDKKEPLFGRANHRLFIKPFETAVLKEILSDYYPNYTADDLLALYTFSGGVAKYVELFIENKAFTKNKIIDYITKENSLLIYEGKSILIEEFGKDYSTYFSILSLIASGHTTRSDIEQILNKEISGYITRLERDFQVITKIKPILSKSETKNIKYIIQDNFLMFWFRFIFKYQYLIETGSNDQLKDIVARDYNTFSGLTLEKYFVTRALETKKYARIGKYWDKKGTFDIDFIAINDVEKTIEFAEIKRNANKIDIEKLTFNAYQYINNHQELIPYKKLFHGWSLEEIAPSRHAAETQ